ncbi:putative DNA-binding protein SNT1 [Wickerhamomyces ciferrii]|uniref:DNA-binding protein SNT1 n=1 Tax=Wickerhamomyces ciferrii (strain ATCC 14091 / BCRC 22168 / CBS 111 / JCM 3599 / NBRC 0793 / NRRL Y-1031 F-60-10) TaxID=1206466 RepID=K0KBF1_WICCF|nr:putative DNA-binding protein SNT1 [Wickerhamomyces ciferrii]CCH42345.1 putative DNA-binding protein SNT1 [Wickerhamomyces ciferrii]
MSADWNPRSKYNGRWGSSGFYGDRDDKNPTNSQTGHSRYRQPSSGDSQRKSNDSSSSLSNRPGLDDQLSSKSNRPYENFGDSYRPYTTNNNQRNSYSATNPYSYNPKKSIGNGGSTYTASPQDNNSGSSYYNYRNSGRSRSSGNGSSSGLNSSSNYYNNKKSNITNHRSFYDRKNSSQRWIRSADGSSNSNQHDDGGIKSYRTNPMETSDHYYPQRDRRSSLISSNSSSSFTPNNNFNNSRKSDKFNNDHTFINERSISPLNSDPYSEPSVSKPSASIPPSTQGYVRKSRPSLIPSNFKDDGKNDEDEDDYELEQALRESSTQTKSDVGDDHDHHENNHNNNQNNESKQNDIKDHQQELISEKLPLTLEHKEELDEHSSKSESITRQSSEESHYDIEPIPSDETPQKDDEDPKEKEQEQSKSTIISKNHDLEKDKVNVNNDESQLPSKQPDLEQSKQETTDDNKEDEEFDNYDPETGFSRDITPQISSQTKTATQEITHVSKIEEKETSISSAPLKTIKDEKPKVIIPRETINGCIFPMQKAELRAWELKNHSKKDILDANPYLLKKPIKDLKDYPFYERNLLAHKQGFKIKIIEKLSVLKGFTFDHKISLWNEYNNRNDEWQERLHDMDQQMKSLYPHLRGESEDHQEQSNNDIEQTTTSSSSKRKRGGRYHGDTVRSEAEFLEILKNLEKEKESDPIFKAETLAAKIPDMILNPIEKNKKNLNVNNLVLDKESWAKRIFSDPIDTFTKKEHELFCEAFLSNPKKFGRISASMGGLRSSQECVLHYYKTKKSLTDYKQLLASKKKKKGKNKGRNRSNKSKDVSSNNTPNPNTPSVETPNESGDEKELQLENFIPKEATIGEDIYTDTGRRRRAAAPVFDSSKPKEAEQQAQQQQSQSQQHPQQNVQQVQKSQSPPTNEEKENERKRSLEVSNGNGEINEDGSSSTKLPIAPQKKKARVGRTRKKEEAKIVTPINENPLAAEFANTSVSVPITSYWSVKDINYFGSLIGEYGTNWPFVASKLRSKTTTMCRNYFAKHADANGWRSIAEEADEKNKSYRAHLERQQAQDKAQQQQQQQQQVQPPVFHQPAPGQPHPQPQHLYPQVIQQFQTQQELKKPPLGVFNSHGDLPSNIQASKPQSNGMLPSVHNLTANSIPTFGNPQPQSIPSLLPKKEPGISTNRSNPFSITSLLNPSEDRRTSPPPPPLIHQQHLPKPGSFTVPKIEESISLPNPQHQPSRIVSNGTTSSGSSVLSMLNSDDGSQQQQQQPKPFNPLTTLLAAADGQRNDQHAINGGFTNGQNTYPVGTPTSTSSIPLVQSAPHSHRGLDIFNPAPEPLKSQGSQGSQGSQFQPSSQSSSSSYKLPSNFNNILSGDSSN